MFLSNRDNPSASITSLLERKQHESESVLNCRQVEVESSKSIQHPNRNVSGKLTEYCVFEPIESRSALLERHIRCDPILGPPPVYANEAAQLSTSEWRGPPNERMFMCESNQQQTERGCRCTSSSPMLSCRSFASKSCEFLLEHVVSCS
jgi:hypothetical protein